MQVGYISAACIQATQKDIEIPILPRRASTVLKIELSTKYIHIQIFK